MIRRGAEGHLEARLDLTGVKLGRRSGDRQPRLLVLCDTGCERRKHHLSDRASEKREGPKYIGWFITSGSKCGVLTFPPRGLCEGFLKRLD